MSHPNVVSHIHQLKNTWKNHHILVEYYYDNDWTISYTARDARESIDRWLVQCLVEFVQAYAATH